MAQQTLFFGWRVVGGAFVLALFGWGFGFYGPPIYLEAVRALRGWPLPTVSAAVTVHFLVGALVVANLSSLHRRFGLAPVTAVGALALAGGVLGWALVTAPWQLFVATAVSGAGWAATSAAAINALVSPWFARRRPAALSSAYNGASLGGVVFSPVWVALIAQLGFPLAALTLGLLLVATVWLLAALLFRHTPESMGLHPDGAAEPPAPVQRPPVGPLARDGRFVTLAVAMALGLFAQVGLISHLYSVLVPALGVQGAGWAMGLGTVCALVGRTGTGWLMPVGADRRLVSVASYAVQMMGLVAFIAAGGGHVPLLLAGVVLFGLGIGNATSLPPLIAQAEFAPEQVARVVALIVALSQAGYAFAPATFGLVRAFAPTDAGYFASVMLVHALATAAFLLGRRR